LGAAWIGAALLLCLLAPGGLSRADGFPSRPIRLIVPFTPGGPVDFVGRELALQIGERLGQPVVVENRAGAGGVIGTDVVAKSAPDGYTIGLGSSGTLSIAPSVVSLPYDTVRDLTPIVHVSNYAEVLVASPKLGVLTLEELVARARKNPGAMSFGSSGRATTSHLAGELLKREAGIDLTHVPYRGAAAALSDLLGGHIDVMFAGISTVLSHVASGRLVALAVASAQREASLPGVPTTAELGLPGVLAEAWTVLFAVAGTPPEVLAKLHGAAAAALASPELQARLRQQGASTAGGTPEQCAAFLRAEADRWGPLARSVDIHWE
jgi:tripartite-type tricarboxylate transporter receptor subunit TctC